MFITRLTPDQMTSKTGGPIRSQAIPLPAEAGAPFRCVFGNVQAGREGSEKGHPASEVYLFLQGAARLWIGDQSFQVERGDVYFIPPNTPHGVDNREGADDIITLALFWNG